MYLWYMTIKMTRAKNKAQGGDGWNSGLFNADTIKLFYENLYFEQFSPLNSFLPCLETYLGSKSKITKRPRYAYGSSSLAR